MARKIGKDFMEHTRFGYLEMSDQMKGLPPPPLELPCDETEPVIDLPSYEKCTVRAATITDAINNRRSIRSYADTPLSLGELSYLLWCTQGIREIIPGVATFRTVPSAGARHAFETYLLVNNVEGLVQGLYRFLAGEHKLVDLRAENRIANIITEGCLGQESVKESAVTFLWSSVVYRMTWRYGERGYRYLHLDAGHVCQNLYLAAEDIHCGVCAIAAFDDDKLNRALAFDGEKQFVIYIATVGKKRI